MPEYPENGGSFSLQNSLRLAKRSLDQIGAHGTREIILIYGALCTIDRDDIFQTIKSIAHSKITCHVISLSAELYICKILAQFSGGVFHVALNESHFKELVEELVPPQPVDMRKGENDGSLAMGFPLKNATKFPTECSCHQRFTYHGFNCPRCKSKTCDLPSDCKICGLSLVSFTSVCVCL